MGRIQRLPEDIIRQIAAGEVIERPASIVKELVENAIDAKANRIFVRLENGGTTSVTVIDNGLGIDKEDIPLALERHATSKIVRQEDLYNIGTLGFRGEALASISSVSKMTIESCNGREGTIGTKIGVHNGKIVHGPTYIGRPRGTSILVEDLFFNVPARKKFLKSSRVEMAYIVEIVSRFAMVYPDIQFSLEQNGKTYVRTNGNNQQGQAIASIYGRDLFKDLIPIDCEKEGIKITGYISNVDGARKTRKKQVLSINRRLIKNPTLYQAIEDGVRQHIPPGIFPIAVLNIDIDFDKVDTNAHPTKEQVRITDEDVLKDFIVESLYTTLDEYHQDLQPSKLEKEEHIDYSFRSQQVLEFEIIGQLKDTYIIVDIHDKLMIVDQHAAHEAILYHYLKESILANREHLPRMKIESHITMDITPSQLANFEEHKKDIENMGFRVEVFGEQSLIVREIPKGIDIDGVQDIIENILSEGTTIYNDWLKNTLINASCKSAIKANQKLEQEKMEEIIRELILNQITNCPHGRPLFITMPIIDLEKKFKRIL